MIGGTNGTGIFQPPPPKLHTLFLRPRKGIHTLATIGVMTKANETVTKLFRDETSDFRARRGIQAKKLKRTILCGENLFAQYDEVAAENLMVQVIRVL